MAEPSAFERRSGEVYVTRTAFSHLDAGMIATLKDEARNSPRKRCRVCTHADADRPFHSMLIAMDGGSYVVPQKHLNKDEVLHFIEGEGAFFLFDEQGAIEGIVPIGAPGSGRSFLVHVPQGRYHGLVILSPWLVFHESTTGPFDPAATIDAEWAPGDSDRAGVEAYIRRLTEAARAAIA